MNRWSRLSFSTLIDTPWLRVTADRCQMATGRIVDPFFVVHEPEWVCIVAVSDGNEVLTVRQYRYPADAFCTELPGGVIEPGESMEAAARRELLEETGHAARRWAYAGRLFANPARQTNSVHIFVAQGLERVAGQTLDPTETLTWAFHSPAWIEAAISRCEFSHATHVATFYRGMQWLNADREG